MKILVVGIKRYAKHESNPGEAILPLIKQDGVKTVLLDATYEGVRSGIAKAIEEEKPDYIIGVSLSPFRQEPVIEQYAFNRMDSVQPDEDGVLKMGEPIVEGGPASLSSSIEATVLEQILNNQEIECTISFDGGRFVCNEAFYLSLHSGIPSLYVHLPLEEEYPLEEDVKLINAVIKHIKRFELD